MHAQTISFSEQEKLRINPAPLLYFFKQFSNSREESGLLEASSSSYFP